MPQLPTIEEIKKIFAIAPFSNEEDNVTDDIYSLIQPEKSKVKFEEKVKELGSEISDILDSKDLGYNADFVAENLGIEKAEIEAKENKSEEEGLIPVEEIYKEEIVSETSIDEENEDVQTQELNIKSVDLSQWNTESPSPKFDNFYREKKKVLKELGIEKKPFNKYIKDLEDARVNVSISLYDTKAIHEKIKEVQGWRDRVKDIQMECRYFQWEKAMQLLEGLLARVEYAKPVAKQQGVIYEHLADMQLYFSRMKDISDAAEIVVKNLNGAYDCLSRQLTIALPEKDRVVYDNNNRFQNDSITEMPFPPIEKRSVPDTLKDFDELENVPVTSEGKVVDLENATKEMRWEDL